MMSDVAVTFKGGVMAKPYSEDLRQRIVEAYESGAGSYSKVAEIFSVSDYSVKVYVKAAREGRPLKAKPHSGGKSAQKLFEPHYSAIERWLAEDPELFWWEVAQRLETEFDLKIDPSQISRQMKRRGFSEKKQRTASSKPAPPRSRENARDGEGS